MEAAGRPPTRAPMLPVDAFERFVKGMLAAAPELRVESLREAVARAPEDVRARLSLWEATTDAGDSEAALEIARSVPPESPAFRPARLLAARSLVALGRLDEAFEGLRALGEEKADAQLFEHMGLVQLRRGSPTETGRATYYYQRAVDLTPEDPDALFNLGYAYWVEQDAAGASYWLRRAVARRPTDGVARHLLGLALDALGRLEEGAREQALARRVSDVVARWDAEGGRDILDSGALARIRQPSPAPQIAQIEARLGDAARLVGERLARHHLERGRMLFEARRDELAIEELDRAIRLAPQLPDAFVLAGRLHLRAGQPEQALALLRLAPASSEVDELLDQIRTAAVR